MPKETFLKLPEEKQKKIIEIAKKEFTRKMFEEVSINQIIKEAEISRGSFYIYFEDKEDLYKFLIQSHHKKIAEITLETITKNKTLKEAFIELFEIMINEFNEDNIFIQKIFLNSNQKTENFMTQNSACQEKSNMLKEIESSISKENIKPDIETKILVELHFGLLINSIIMYIKTKDLTIKENFEKQLKILETGYRG